MILRCAICKGIYIRKVGIMAEPIPEEKLDPKDFLHFECDKCGRDIWILRPLEGG